MGGKVSPEYQREYRRRNAAKLREQAREYYLKNADEIRKRARDAYHENKEYKRLKSREYAERNREAVKACRKRYWRTTRKKVEADREAIPSYRAARIIARAHCSARKRGIECTISVEHIIDAMNSGKCEVTRLPLDMHARRGPWRPSIDRIDSSKGYVPGNVRIVVWMYNAAKQQYSDEDVRVMARALIGTETQGAAS